MAVFSKTLFTIACSAPRVSGSFRSLIVEFIQVRKQHCKHLFRMRCVKHFLFQEFDEMSTVRQPRQHVMVSQITLLFLLLAL